METSVKNTREMDALQTSAEMAPVTLDRRVDGLLQLDKLSQPHVPRALVAVDKEHPLGSPDHQHHQMTVLQQHVAFFDRNHDGIIYPWETYTGFRVLGFNPLVSFIAMLFININFSYPTLESWIPDPLFPVYIKNVHRTKHGSDSDVYDTEGRFTPSKFEEIFSKYAHTHPQYLTYDELFEMTEAIRNAMDWFGWIASKLEWGFTYWLAKNEKGMVSKEAIRGVYDGSFFEYLEKQQLEKKNKKYA